jgi:hypothetical protein
MQKQNFTTSENIQYFKIISLAKCKAYHGESLQIEDLEHFRDCQKEINIPSSFFDAIEQYGYRNIIWIQNTIHGKSCMHGRVCLRCLKAFSIHKAKELSLGEGVIGFLSKKFDCETGHSGYFLNNGDPLQAY